MAANEDLKDLDITKEELDRLQKALKDEKFRKMFVEYAEEISNPENRKKYEAEIAELERNRGMDVKFINPEPGYVIKTSVDGVKKGFINFCMNENVGKPVSKFTTQNGQSGFQWSIPHSMSPSRDDLDKTGSKCIVFDCVFNPECFKLAEKDARFQKVIEDTAFDAVEREFQVALDRKNLKRLKNMKYKGNATTTVIRTPNSQGPTSQNDSVSALNLSYPYDDSRPNSNSNKPSSKSLNSDISCAKIQSKPKGDVNGKIPSLSPVEPKYTITHRGVLDMQQFVNAPDSRPSTRPQELIIRIELPLLKSAMNIQLDVFERRLCLESNTPASYKLDLTLPFPVDEDHGNAKFDKSKSCMIVTLPVLPPEIPALPSFAPNGVEKPLVQEIADVEASTQGSPDENKSYLETADMAVPTNGENEGFCENALISKESEVIANISYLEKDLEVNDVNGNVDKIPFELESEGTSKIQSNSTKETPSENHCALLEDDSNHAKQNSTELQSDIAASVTKTFILPKYSFYQGVKSLTIIMMTPSVAIDSVRSELSEEGNGCWLQYHTQEDGQKGGMSYGLQLMFSEGLGVTSVTFDVSSTNVVFILQKKTESEGEWKSINAGLSRDDLQLKKFTTQSNIQESLEELQLTAEQSGKVTEMTRAVCEVKEQSPDSVVLDVEILQMEENSDQDPSLANVHDGDVNKDDGKSSDTQLNIDIKDINLSEADSTSSETSPLSPDSKLKSSLRTQRKRCSKSVSFSEEVTVETFLYDKGKRGRKKSPFIRRSKEKLKAPAQETCSDSELILSCKDGEESEEDIWNIVPVRRTVSRQSSSESESDGLLSPRGKHKKSKGSRQRRKEKARRALLKESSSEETEPGLIQADTSGIKSPVKSNHLDMKSETVLVTDEASDTSSSREAESITSEESLMSSGGDGKVVSKAIEDISGKEEEFEGNHESRVSDGEEDEEWTTVSKKRHPRKKEGKKDKQVEGLGQEDEHVKEEGADEDGECSKTNSKSDVKQEKEDSIPLEHMDHRTTSAVSFSNEVMFDLDD